MSNSLPKPKRQPAKGNVSVPVWFLVMLFSEAEALNVDQVVVDIIHGHNWVNFALMMVTAVGFAIIMFFLVFPKVEPQPEQ